MDSLPVKVDYCLFCLCGASSFQWGRRCTFFIFQKGQMVIRQSCGLFHYSVLHQFPSVDVPVYKL